MATQISTWMRLGTAIREARAQQGLTQTAAASKAKVSRSWLAKVEAGHRGAELEPLLRLVDALGLSLTLEPAMDSADAPIDHRNPAPSASQPPRPDARLPRHPASASSQSPPALPTRQQVARMQESATRLQQQMQSASASGKFDPSTIEKVQRVLNNLTASTYAHD